MYSLAQESVVYNLTAVILPYVHNDQKFAHVFYHSKVRLSPEEKRQIEGHYCTCKEGNGYQLFGWHNVWFPVYCCYELASIKDRTLFHSYADMVVAVEWNKDIAYFSSIIESMCRDLHCYCIQANSSGPGDSRVLQPTKSELRDIIKTKGGKNPCILAADINVAALRQFQSLHIPCKKILEGLSRHRQISIERFSKESKTVHYFNGSKRTAFSPVFVFNMG